jgi:hypothetical protein
VINKAQNAAIVVLSRGFVTQFSAKKSSELIYVITDSFLRLVILFLFYQNMLNSALAFCFSMMLTFILGGLLGFLLRFSLALLFIPLIALFRRKEENGSATVISSGPWILTIEFLANIFYGWFANYIGVWVFASMGVPIDWFYPFFVLFAFIWFDLKRIRTEKNQLKAIENNGLRERLPIELLKEEMQEIRPGNFLNQHLNNRYTALFGKIAGVVIGGFNLILLKA